ncbi:MAG TPA: DUF2147 domain-containing protein [Devosia sp.]|nr:DUF2147 domain-containing protein [Devosia sp.]
MKFVLKALAGLALVATMVAPVAAVEKTIVGNWQTGPGDLAYKLEFCGNGEELCGVLTYSRDQDARLQRNVGKQIIDRAKRVGPQSWKGDLIFAGQKMNGTMTLDGDVLHFDGCAYLVICGKFNLYRM